MYSTNNNVISPSILSERILLSFEFNYFYLQFVTFLSQAFFCEYCRVFKHSFFYRTPLVATFGIEIYCLLEQLVFDCYPCFHSCTFFCHLVINPTNTRVSRLELPEDAQSGRTSQKIFLLIP